MSDKIYSGKLPVLALRGLAVFPDQSVHFDVGRMRSVRALEAAMKEGQYIFLVPQKNILTDDPSPEELHAVGTVAQIKQVLDSQSEMIRVLVKGVCRGRITQILQTEPFMEAQIQSIPEPDFTDSPRIQALFRQARSL